MEKTSRCYDAVLEPQFSLLTIPISLSQHKDSVSTIDYRYSNFDYLYPGYCSMMPGVV